ncbi:MAG: hypothetical protein HY077_01435 [Elusimicrobia bacterium]|nr:hypothetical protein [Elusimicrobiota bacterium]
MRKTFVLCAALIACAADGLAYRPPKNPRYKRRGESAGPGGVRVSTAALNVTLIDRLEAGRWKPDIKLALEIFAAEHGKDDARYDPDRPPVAALVFDDAAINGDLGEIVFERLVERAEFRFDDDWWKLVPLAYGRQRIRAAYEQFVGLPTTVWGAQPTYRQYVKGMIQSYQDSCRKVDRKDCRIYLARLFKGFTRDEVLSYGKKAFDDEEIRPVASEQVRESPEDPSPAVLRRGLREVPEVRDLARLLLSAGFDVWIIDLDAQPLLTAFAVSYGIDPTRVIGIRQVQFRDKLTGKVEEPVPIRSGKVDAFVSALGRPPALVVGASAEDRELLCYGTGLRLVLDRGDKVFRDYASRRGWLIQPAFGPR